MSLDPSIVTEIAPQFTDDARIAIFLARAERRHTQAAWGAVYADAMAALAAHMLTRFPASAAASSAAGEVTGGVTARSAGDLSESYGDATAGVDVGLSDADLRTTRYGLDYLALRASRSATTATAIRVY